MRALLLMIGLAGCDNGGATPDWSRMITQPKALPFGASTLFSDGAAMRPVPVGTVPRGDDATAPPPITRALLERGRNRFDIVCAACHGLAGDGDSAVAHNMQRRRPPSLHEPRIAALTNAELEHVIAVGYGLMPALAAQLPAADRGAVVAYVRTLQLAARAPVAMLPTDATRGLR